MSSAPNPLNIDLPLGKRRQVNYPEDARRDVSRAIYPRKRAVTACQTCRGRKKKCDNGRPCCGFCLETGSSCNYAVNKTAMYDSASLDILDRLSVIETLLRSGEHSSPSLAQTEPDINLEPSEPRSANQLSTPKILKASSTLKLDLDLPSLSRVRTDTVLSWPSIQDALSSAKRYYFLDQDGNRNFTYLSNPTLDSCNEVRAGGSTAESFRYSIDRIDVEKLVSQFFLHAHTKNPILNRATVKEYCNDLYENGAMWNLSTCLVLLICALGAVARKWEYLETTSLDPDSVAAKSRYEDLELAKGYYLAAEKRLGLALRIQGTLSVQCLCLAGIFCMYTLDSSGALNMFHAAGTVLQTAISAREILAEFPIGHLALTHLELSERYPSPPLRENGDSLKDEWAMTEDSWYYYLAEIALRRIADKAVQALFPQNDLCDFYRSDYSIQNLIPTTNEFQRQVVLWHESLPLSMTFPESPVPVDSELRYFLRSRYYLILELLHRPFLCYAIHNPGLASPEIFQLAQECLRFAYNYLVQSNHTHRHHGKWLQLRREVTASCLLLTAAGNGIEPPQEWRSGVERTLEHLRYWSIEVPVLQSWEQTVQRVNNYFAILRGFENISDKDGEAEGSNQNHSWPPSSPPPFG